MDTASDNSPGWRRFQIRCTTACAAIVPSAVWTGCPAVIWASNDDLLDDSNGRRRCAVGIEVAIQSLDFRCREHISASFRLLVRRPPPPGGADDHYTVAS